MRSVFKQSLTACNVASADEKVKATERSDLVPQGLKRYSSIKESHLKWGGKNTLPEVGLELQNIANSIHGDKQVKECGTFTRNRNVARPVQKWLSYFGVTEQCRPNPPRRFQRRGPLPSPHIADFYHGLCAKCNWLIRISSLSCDEEIKLPRMHVKRVRYNRHSWVGWWMRSHRDIEFHAVARRNVIETKVWKLHTSRPGDLEVTYTSNDIIPSTQRHGGLDCPSSSAPAQVPS